MASSGANAVTIDQFDAASQDVKNKVVSLTLQDLLGQAARKSGKEAARCMVNAFTVFNASAGETAPHGMNLISAQLKVQRDLKKADTTHVEHVVAAVFDSLLQDRCLKPGTQTGR